METADEEAEALANEFFADARSDTWFAKAMGKRLRKARKWLAHSRLLAIQIVLAVADSSMGASRKFAGKWESVAVGERNDECCYP